MINVDVSVKSSMYVIKIMSGITLHISMKMENI